MIPLLWLIAGAVLILAEVLSGALVLLMFGAAALVTAGASALGAPLGVDVAVFAVASAAGVLLARPALSRRLRVADPVNTGPRGLLGAAAEVLEPIGTDHVGTVRIAGAVWSARALHDDALGAGERVVVVDITGATAVVAPSRTPGRAGESGES